MASPVCVALVVPVWSVQGMGSQFVKAVNERSCKVIMCMLCHLYTLLSLCASIYENLLWCVEASQSTVLALKIRHPLCNKKFVLRPLEME